MYDIDVEIPLGTWPSSIILQFDGTLIILIGNTATDLVSLLFQEVSVTDNLYQEISHPNNLGLVWTLSV